jgi:hypothetical protein
MTDCRAGGENANDWPDDNSTVEAARRRVARRSIIFGLVCNMFGFVFVLLL